MTEINKIPVKIIKNDTPVAPSTDIISIDETSEIRPKKRMSRGAKFAAFILIFIIIILAAFSTQILFSGQSVTNNLVANFSFLGKIKNLAESAERPLKGEDRDRINIILLGIGGKGHDGAYLTDTIMLGSMKPSNKKVAMISIPRDLTVPIEGYGWRKVNSIDAFAEKQKEGSGGLAVSQSLTKILDTPIDYYVRLDFEGFINVVDEIGGIDVEVENTLDDYSYPIIGREDIYPLNSRYEHLHIEKGLQHMDGSLALKFARSRHGAGKEGSDFARSRRQQLILHAVKDKLLSTNTLFKPMMISDIIKQLADHVSTNLNIWEIVKLWDMFKNVQKDDITNRVLDNGPNGLLVSSISSEGAYILTPRSGDFSDIQYLVANVFADSAAADKSKLTQEKPIVDVMNGTWVTGLAAKTALDLEKLDYTISYVGNSSHKNFEESVVYDLSNGTKSESLNTLKDKYGASVLAALPQWLTDELAKRKINEGQSFEQPDFILILGKNRDSTSSGVENPAK